MGIPFWKMCSHLLEKIFWSNFCRRTSHPPKAGQVVNARFQREQSLVCVPFFNQRHPQTKTNVTERNDGLIDGSKSRSRWDFVAFKDFISGLWTRRRKVVGKLPVKLNLKIWLKKTWISLTDYRWRKSSLLAFDPPLSSPLRCNTCLKFQHSGAV